MFLLLRGLRRHEFGHGFFLYLYPLFYHSFSLLEEFKHGKSSSSFFYFFCLGGWSGITIMNWKGGKAILLMSFFSRHSFFFLY